MKKTSKLALLAILTCSAALVASCSNDDPTVYTVIPEKAVNTVTPEQTNQPGVFGTYLKQFKIETPHVSFDALTKLSFSLHQGTAKVVANDAFKQYADQFTKSLTSLLDNLLQGNGQNQTETRSWQLGDLTQTLQSAIDVSNILESLNNYNLLGPDSISESFNIVVNDSLTYKVTVDKKRGNNVAATSVGNTIQRKVTIDKNGTWLMTIDTNQGNTAKIKENHLEVGSAITGSLTYDDLKFTLDQQIQGTDSLVTTLGYQKNNAPIIDITAKTNGNLNWENLVNNNVLYTGKLIFNLLGGTTGIECNINDLSKFFDIGVETSKYLLSGKNKDNCQQLTDKVNSVVSSHLNLLGTDCGILSFEPLLTDSINNTYEPAVMIQTSPTDEKIAVKDILDAFGITVESLMNMVFS